MNLATLLAALAWPMVSRVLTALGLGVVSYVGASEALHTATVYAKQAFAGITPDVLQLLAMAGILQAISIMLGGIAGGIAFMALKRFGFTAAGA